MAAQAPLRAALAPPVRVQEQVPLALPGSVIAEARAPGVARNLTNQYWCLEVAVLHFKRKYFHITNALTGLSAICSAFEAAVWDKPRLN